MLAGFSFCLASDTVQGFYFCPAACEPLTSIYSGFSAANAIIPPQRQKRLQGFTVAFPLICPTPAHTMQQPHKPPMHSLFHAGGHTVKCSASTDTTATPDVVQGRAAAYYNKVYKGAGVRPVMDLWQTVPQIANHTSPAGS